MCRFLINQIEYILNQRNSAVISLLAVQKVVRLKVVCLDFLISLLENVLGIG